MARKLLLYCGILSSLLYTAMNICIALQWSDYSSMNQTVSELSAIGAPTRSIWVGLGYLYTTLFTLFGVGVVLSAHQNRRLKYTGRLIFIYGIVSFAWPFAPMHLRGEPFGMTDAMHIALGIVTVILMILTISIGSLVFEKQFRWYSWFSIFIFIVFGTLTGMGSPGIAKDMPTPWLGVWERINIGVFLLWVIVFSLEIMKQDRKNKLETSAAV